MPKEIIMQPKIKKSQHRRQSSQFESSSVSVSTLCQLPHHMGSKKSKRKRAERPTIHPRNKYSENPPDFALLASLYPSFEPFVFYSRDGRPRIDWTDYNATRELTRVLLLHDHGLNWWIPDGQLCPTVPNRSNYIHWIEDLLSSDIIPKIDSRGDAVRGFDIGTGSSCIYPLLGASLLGWSFVGSDVTDVAVEWAEKNVRSNGHISDLIEIRKVENSEEVASVGEFINGESTYGERGSRIAAGVLEEIDIGSSSSSIQPVDKDQKYCRPPVLLGVVRDGEKFDFCMCNPPFFETMEEAGLNPKTSCGGTPEEMVCSGGEKAFITRIIEDSIVLKDSFRWYTTMVGRKTNLKFLTSKLREVGISIVKTTEFVQGQTCRWGLAWSFLLPTRKIISPHVSEKSTVSFMLESVQRQFSAMHVLQSIESFFCNSGAFCKLNAASFAVDINASRDECDAILNSEPNFRDEATSNITIKEASRSSSSLSAANDLHFRITVFQQIPGTLLVKGSKQQIANSDPPPGVFSSIIQRLENFLRQKFCRAKTILS